jgi:hypothetical protein
MTGLAAVNRLQQWRANDACATFPVAVHRIDSPIQGNPKDEPPDTPSE